MSSPRLRLIRPPRPAPTEQGREFFNTLAQLVAASVVRDLQPGSERKRARLVLRRREGKR